MDSKYTNNLNLLNDKLYIIIPAYNEEENIRKVIEDWYGIVEKIGNDFLTRDRNLEKISLPKVEKIGSDFIFSNENKLLINVPKLLELHPFQSHKELFKIVEENKKQIENVEGKRI